MNIINYFKSFFAPTRSFTPLVSKEPENIPGFPKVFNKLPPTSSELEKYGALTMDDIEKISLIPRRKLTKPQLEARSLFQQRNWDRLISFKRSRRKSWQALGFTEAEEATINAVLNGGYRNA